MAKKITQLTAIDAASAGDVLPIVDDPAGSPATKKVTVTQILATAEKIANKDFAGGYPSLDSGGKIPIAEIPTLTLAKLPSESASTLLGRRSGSAGTPEEVTLGTGLTMSAAAVLSTTAVAQTTLAAEILADTPRAFWKGDDASSTLVDSSGNGFNLTSLTGSFNYRWGLLSYLLPTTKFIQQPDGATHRVATLSNNLGIAAPWTGDVSVEAMCMANLDPAAGFVFAFSNTGEAEDSNFQFGLGCDPATGILRVFWEFGAGTNEVVSSGVKLVPGVAYHIVAVKDGTANTVDFYINGKRVITVAYSNEPSGGTIDLASFGGSIGGAGDNWRGTVGYVAVYNAKLTEARIMQHAIAAGLIS